MIPTMDRPVTLFDLDGVLSRQDTMATLVTQATGRRTVRLVAAVPLVLLARMAPPHGRLKPAINRKLVALALYGVTESEYRGLADATAQRLAARPTNVPAQALSEFKAARRLGRVIVTTGTERHLAATYLHAIGIRSVELQASALTFSGKGVRLTQHNVGSAKTTALRAAGVELPAATLYTDSASDLQLAQRVGRVVLVNPSSRSRRIMARQPIAVAISRWP